MSAHIAAIFYPSLFSLNYVPTSSIRSPDPRTPMMSQSSMSYPAPSPNYQAGYGAPQMTTPGDNNIPDDLLEILDLVSQAG